MKRFRRAFFFAGIFFAYLGLLRYADSGAFEDQGMLVDSEFYTSEGILSPASNRRAFKRAVKVRFHPKRLEKECAIFHPTERKKSPARDIISVVEEAARIYRLDPELLYAVMFVESRCRQAAVSPKGAIGLMQVLPATAHGIGITDPHTVRGNIHAGAKYLSQLKRNFGSVQLALAAYNAGPGAVKNYAGIPPYRETRRYTSQVLTLYNALRQERAAQALQQSSLHRSSRVIM